MWAVLPEADFARPGAVSLGRTGVDVERIARGARPGVATCTAVQVTVLRRPGAGVVGRW